MLRISASCAQSQLSPKEEKETCIKYSSNTSVLFAKDQNSSQHQKTFAYGERLLPFGFALL
jgi:hypothetical protein